MREISFQLLDWRVFPRLNRLQSSDQEITLQPRVMRLLSTLVEAEGEVLTRDELLTKVWSGELVTDSSLSNSISELRQVFDRNRQGPPVIETIRGVGYRLTVSARFESCLNEPQIPKVAVAESSGETKSLPDLSPARGISVSREVGVLLVLIVAVALAGLVGRAQGPLEVESASFLTSLPGAETVPRFSPDGGSVAFVSLQGARYPKIFVESVTDRTPVALIDRPGAQLHPAWSPDGDRLAFLEHLGDQCFLAQVSLLSRQLKRLREVACDLRGLSWSPRGDLLAYSAHDPEIGRRSIRLLELSTLRTQSITEPVFRDSDPVFSPDGYQLAFWRWWGPVNGDLFVIAINSTDPLAANVVRHSFESMDNCGLDFSPDGREILMLGQRQGQPGLWRLDLKSGGLELVRAVASADLCSMSVSPVDGAIVVADWTFVTRLELASLAESPALASEPPQTSQSDRWASFSPDGEALAFVSSRSGSEEVWTRKIADGVSQRITDLEAGPVVRPQWSPDGKTILFEATHEGRGEIQLVAADGSGHAQAWLNSSVLGERIGSQTKSLPRQLGASWSRDGREILYSSDEDGSWALWRRSLKAPEQGRRLLAGTYRRVEETPDGRLVFQRLSDAAVWIWDGAGEPELLVANLQDWDLVDDGLYFLRLSTDQRERDVLFTDLAAASSDPILLLPIRYENAFADSSWGLSISPDRRWMVHTRVARGESDLILLSGA